MADYDFKQLNDKEFEILCADILSIVENNHFERFKPGKDAGVDGRFFNYEGKEVILQCKHWSNTPLKQLINELIVSEKPKIKKINPNRYILAVSNPLSRADKQKIHQGLSPYILSESDIYGKEDLNDLINQMPEVEKRHYKLWLHSSSVLSHIFNNDILGRSEFSLKEIVESSARYVVTSNHEAALNKLEKLGVVVISGEPGVGKTTLADHLCLHYVSNGFAYLKISEEIREAESIFDFDTKQLFYFDDFLGRNYLDALKGHEGSQITQFIRRVAKNKNKRFILTSRSTILNQGKLLSDSFEQNNLQRNEFELCIKSLSDLDKAQILYNHIWHSGLEVEYVEQLYLDKRYRIIISHRNFNPRLISYVTDPIRLENYPSETYWKYISESLTNPSQVWDNSFVVQLDDFGRVIVLLIVLNGYAIEEDNLSKAFHRYIALPENQNLQGKREFQTNIRLLAGSFINRIMNSNGPVKIDLFNPSIGDYVLRRYANDVTTIFRALISLQTYHSLITLRSLVQNSHLLPSQACSICIAIVRYLSEKDFSEVDVRYVSLLCTTYKYFCEEEIQFLNDFKSPIFFIINNAKSSATDDSFEAIEWALECHAITPIIAMDFAFESFDNVSDDNEIRAISSLLTSITRIIPEYEDKICLFRQKIVGMVAENLSDWIAVDDAFSNVDYRDYDGACIELGKIIDYKLNDLGLSISADDISYILEGYDVAYELDRFYEGRHDWDLDHRSVVPEVLFFDEIDDLFDRS